MSAEALELVFTGSAVLGALFLLLSTVGRGLHVRLHVPVRLPHLPHVRVGHADNATAMPILLGSLAMFGIGGLFGSVAFGLGPGGRLLVASGFGLVGAAITFAIFALLHRAQGREPTDLHELVGRHARVVVSISESSRGMVALTYDGAVQTLPAAAETAIAAGERVEIAAIRGMGVVVQRKKG